MRSEHSVVVRRSPADVLSYVANVERWNEWALRVVEVKRTRSGPLAPGEAFTVVARLWGRNFPQTYTVLDLVPGQKLEWKGDQATFTFLCEPDGDGTRLTERVDLRPQGILRLLAPFLLRLSNRQLAANHAALKTHLERS